MGRIKTALIKRTTLDIFAKNKDIITEDFNKNKKIVEGIADIPSPKLRNTIAGYLTRLKKSKEDLIGKAL